VVGYSALESQLARWGIASILPLSASDALFVAAIAAVPILFLLLLLSCWLGAALGAFGARKRPDAPDAAQAGVGSFWVVVLFAALVSAVLPDAGWSEMLRDVLWTGIPLFTVWLCALWRRPGYEPQRLARRLQGLLTRGLVWRWSRGGRSRTLDLRGAALGLAAGGLALAVSALHLLQPLQTSALLSLIPLRSTLRQLQAAGPAERPPSPASAPAARAAGAPTRSLPAPSDLPEHQRIVLLRWMPRRSTPP
jgi:hypothetical protein